MTDSGQTVSEPTTDDALSVASPPVRGPSFEAWFSRFDSHHDHIERLKFLSDGVFAIAMTLLAIELRPPEDWNGRLDGLGHEFLVGCIAYLIGFAILGAIWVQQRRMLALLVGIDSVAVGLTLTTLAGVCLLPAGIRLQIRYSAAPNSFVIYGGIFLAVTTASTLFWGYVALLRRLVRRDLPERYRRGHFVVQALGNFALVFGILGFAQAPPSGEFSGESLAWLVAALALGLIATPVRRWSRKVPPEAIDARSEMDVGSGPTAAAA